MRCTAGFEYEVVSDLALGVRGIYRAQGSVIEDGSFDDGTTYFLFNPGESHDGRRLGLRTTSNHRLLRPRPPLLPRAGVHG